MQTQKITINSNGNGMPWALDMVEDFSRDMGFDERSARRTRLLAEETMSMVRAIVGEFVAEFWMESKPECSCILHLHADSLMNFEKKQELIETSSRQRNEASVGIMGKIQDFIEDSLYSMEYSQRVTMGGSEIMSLGGVALAMDGYMWSLDKYREDVEQKSDEEAAMDAALEELEKSIVANIADDIRVYVKGNTIEMIIEKNFPVIP
ncbi:hypothetical protein SELR_14780 [Selenomonas ruminantium subsp. lactilytica TAM6421]|uniref:Uncharacterized protein n=1 Tax=Selenomonas ruminantium subsp. lactilytica (strain NBRC 103574 / TAM6421) TaxID=927704 RepID=I0GQZ9_SELRL|nr:hypothetical protein [Selenomonas ruminantium]BAL83186.1 hypothetical protein SELR_14780 [Selenomonas ruminantium subsp. lactilytica TAM6421]